MADKTPNKTPKRTTTRSLGRDLFDLRSVGSTRPTGSAGLSFVQGERLAAAVSTILNSLLVVLAFLDTLAGKLLAKGVLFIPVLVFPPLLDGTEHNLTDFVGTVLAAVTERRMVEHPVDNPIQSPLDIRVFVVPTLHQLRHDPLDDLRSDPTSWFVEYI